MEFADLGQVADASKIVREPRKVAKATIQRGGRFGFSKTGSEIMGLRPDKRLLLVANDKEQLYAKVVGNDDRRGFRLMGTRDYISMPARELLESLGINYASQIQTFIYDITPFQIDDSDGGQIWKFALRVVPTNHRVNSKEDSSSDTVS